MKTEAAANGEEQPTPKTPEEELEDSIIKTPKPEGKYIHRYVYRNALTGRLHEGWFDAGQPGKVEFFLHGGKK